MELIRQCCKPRLYNKGLRIVGLSSTVVALGEKAHSIYAGTKGAMEASVRCLAQELAPKGICINTVEPGMTKTDMYKAFLEQWGENSEVHRKFLEKQYLGIVEPECVANTIVFLLSDAAKYITGTTVIVDGGLTSSC
jgi:NAD(P)-dependent dehydrogenase (short-subunit alcohol dehydrogenase family)